MNCLIKKKELSFVTTSKNQTYISVNEQIKNTKEILIENVNNLIANAKIYEKELESQLNSFNKNIENLPSSRKDIFNLAKKTTIKRGDSKISTNEKI